MGDDLKTTIKPETTLWRRLMCRLGRHKRLVIVARVSASTDHVACPASRQQFGMNHDVRSLLPWHEVASLYAERGYDDRAAMRKTFG
jgi:hypothetical protein